MIAATTPAAESTGLSSAEATRRLASYGPNEPVRVQRLSALRQLLGLFANPLVIILLVASVISALLGEVQDAVIIVTMVLMGVGINFWQGYRAEQAAAALRAMVTPTATVCRDGSWKEIRIRDVVPGDLIRLSAGDLVPADSQLLQSHDLSIQQAMLTGESLPTEKVASAEPSGSGPDARHLVFLGTSVISGTGTAVALKTGPQTLFGDIAARLQTRPEETEFERGLHRFSLLILTTTVTLVLFILLVSVALKHNAFESLLFAVALGVGLTPEFLPMISSVTLTQGAMRMAEAHVIVKHLPAIQDFGSIDVLCSDKTGTLTSGVMQINRSIDASGADSPRPLQLAYVNSRFETGIRSPFDAAILQVERVDPKRYTKVDEIPFDFERRRLSVVVTRPDDEGGGRLLIAKGGPESVLSACTQVERGSATNDLDDALRQNCRQVYEALSADGFRVLAIAHRRVEARDSYSRSDESGLVLAGFVSFADSVLPDAAETIAALKADGVHIKILTGDSDVVAAHVCRQVGVAAEAIVSGEDIDRLDDVALAHVVEQASTFTRVSPAQKSRIIQALKRRGHVVGYIGDGINDAPSLHAADVGISVMSATDVAREAADIILGESSLKVLHRGILEGRRASGNMMKYLLMGTSSNFGNMFSMAAASIFLPFLPMLPTQILLNNLLYDLAQITIPTDNVDAIYLQRPQRWDIRVIRDFMIFIGPISSLFDFLTFFALLRIFHASEELFHTGWFVESLATQTLVLFVIRTMGNPFRSRPSVPLTVTTIAIVAVGAWLPVSPLAQVLGFTAPPPEYFALLVAAVCVYLVLVELGKRWLVRRLGLAV